MRVLFLTLYPETAASPRYRVHQFLPYLRERGFECAVAAPMDADTWTRLTGPERSSRPFWYHLRETPARLRQILGARGYDVVFLQKALMSAYVRGFPALLARCAPRLVYDFDDAVHLAPPHGLRFPWSCAQDRDQVQKLFRQARLVLAGNAWLAEAARGAGARTELFPTVVDTCRFVPPAQAPREFRVGWIGSPATTPHLAGAAETLGALAPGECALVGADPKQVHFSGATHVPWRYDTEVASVQQFSAGIMPQPKDQWTRGKCALKALLCMACGVPCVATPHGAVLEIIRDGENGLFADSPGEWTDALQRLRDPAFRARLGAAARATVEERFSLAIAAPRLARFLEEIA